MTTEEKLKEYILSRYKSIREFTIAIDMPYSTLDGVLKRGIDNSSVGVIFKICKALNISPDALAEGEIVPKPLDRNIVIGGNQIDIEEKEVEQILEDTKKRLLTPKEIYIEGVKANKAQLKSIINGILICT